MLKHKWLFLDGWTDGATGNIEETFKINKENEKVCRVLTEAVTRGGDKENRERNW